LYLLNPIDVFQISEISYTIPQPNIAFYT